MLLPVFAVFATGSEIERHLNQDYVGKYFIIRCLCSGDDLVYDMAGHVIRGDERSESWTLADVGITNLNVREKDSKLEIRGQRMGLIYNSATNSFQRQYRSKQHALRTELQKLRITIQADKQATENDWRSALNNGFRFRGRHSRSQCFRTVARLLPK